MTWLKRIFGSVGANPAREPSTNQPGSRRITAKDPLVIQSPRIGFFNLMGPSAQALLAQDKAALGPLFASSAETDTSPPECDVLLIYGRVESDGRLVADGGLRDVIRKAKAPIAILASENDPKNLIAAAKPTGYGQANLVLTLGRKGAVFPAFFSELFRSMYKGVSMPLAWVRLAPQNPGAKQENVPDTIFAAEVSHIVFR